MGLRIATNVASMAAQRNMSKTTELQKKHFQRISSGNRITSAGDDAAGLSISENMRATVRSLRQAERNTNDGISLTQVAEGALNEVGNIVIRLRELGIQAASDTVGDEERGFIDEEVQSLIQEVDRIANVTTFNGTPLLNGEADKDTLEIQVGTRNDEADRIGFDTTENNVTTSELGIDSLSYESIEDARDSLDTVDSALNLINAARARLGAMTNKLHSTVSNLQISNEMLSQARSRIADADIAEETSELVRENILQSAGIAVLAQANSAPTAALRLL